MPAVKISVRVTRKTKCNEGFYALINGARLWFKTRRAAFGACLSVLELQRLQVVTAREFFEAKVRRERQRRSA
jgi:hypothetical protein